MFYGSSGIHLLRTEASVYSSQLYLGFEIESHMQASVCRAER